MEFSKAHYKIAIVGLGPKGFYALERLLAQLNTSSVTTFVEIHIFERSGFFGAGFVYQPNQPAYLLMNYPNRNINAWSDELPILNVPEQLNFTQWLDQDKQTAKTSNPDGYSPRKDVGRYYMACFQKLMKSVTNHVKVVAHTTEVFEIRKISTGLSLKYGIETDFDVVHVRQVLLTTGHASFAGNIDINSAGHDTDKFFLPFVYPVTRKLAAINPGATVGVKGMGLTFIDTVLALTEGRGGEFEKLDQGGYKYVPSGKEPRKIYPFSTTGLFMVPRTGKENKENYAPVFFTVKNILRQNNSARAVHFTRDILPLLIAETTYRYYRTVFIKYGISCEPLEDSDKLTDAIDVFHRENPEEYRFDFNDLFRSRPFSQDSPELKPKDYLQYVISESRKGSDSSGFMAAALTWGKLSAIFNEIFSFAGLENDSHREFDANYRSRLNRIAYGPPVENMEKIYSLVEVGIVDLTFSKNPTLKRNSQGWSIQCKDSENKSLDVLVDARIPKPNSVHNWSPVFTNMNRHGLLRVYGIENKYQVGCPEIDRMGRAIDVNGRVVRQVTLYGTPTEGVVYDNDTLSRKRNNFASTWAASIAKEIVNQTTEIQEIQ